MSIGAAGVRCGYRGYPHPSQFGYARRFSTFRGDSESDHLRLRDPPFLGATYPPELFLGRFPCEGSAILRLGSFPDQVPISVRQHEGGLWTARGG